MVTKPRYVEVMKKSRWQKNIYIYKLCISLFCIVHDKSDFHYPRGHSRLSSIPAQQLSVQKQRPQTAQLLDQTSIFQIGNILDHLVNN
jgi:hypothetical protein